MPNLNHGNSLTAVSRAAFPLVKAGRMLKCAKVTILEDAEVAKLSRDICSERVVWALVPTQPGQRVVLCSLR